MTKAEQAKAEFEQSKATLSVLRAAKQQDADVEISHTDGMIFYRFDDGSVLGTKGRARGHQLWCLPALDAGE